MKVQSLILPLFFIFRVLVGSQNNSNMREKIEIKEVILYVVEDEMPPPARGLTLKFKSVEAWLQNICNGNKPGKGISHYSVGLFESPRERILCVVGWNSYQNADTTCTSLAFEPANMCFKLPNRYWRGLNKEQLHNQLLRQLKKFTGTEVFGGSFLASANQIVFEPTGEIIWAKP